MHKQISIPETDVSFRKSLLTLLTAALIGAFLGALAARQILSGEAFTGSMVLLPGENKLLRRIQFAIIFPLFLLLADLTQRKAAFLFAFFYRGAAVSCLLCVGLSCFSAVDARKLICALFFHSALSLPLCFFSAARLMRADPQWKGRGRIFVDLLPFAANLAALLPETLLCR